MFTRCRRPALITLIATLLLIPGCAKKPPAATTPPPSSSPTTAPPPPVEEPKETWKAPPPPAAEALPPKSLASQAEEFNRQGALKDILFAFDKSDLDDAARRVLADNAAWMRSHAEFHVLIAGHCDERDTEEYNLALGDRRANAARDYLVSLGIAGARLQTISYGEERPLDAGHNEQAWARNRRGQFSVQAP
jgi:peptidoglycan-associated lipoprotein